jgi:hypothetical protein
MATKIQVRRGTKVQWENNNPTLDSGEIGFETDTGKFKIGNGSTAWNSLEYAGAGGVTSYATEAARDADNPTPDHGDFAFITAYDVLQYYDGSAWVSVPGAVGGEGNKPFLEHDNTVTADYTVTTGRNVISAGPITVDSGATVTLPSGSVWVVV